MAESSWDLTQTDLMKALFAKYANGKSFIEGEDAVRILSASKLPFEVLAKIWDLSDIDDDGRLNTSEFVIAFHLCVCIAKRGLQLPPMLPDILVKWHASQKDRKLPLFAKGHKVIHHRASDGLKRMGTVVGVHSDDVLRGFYYTVRLASDDQQELQANEDRLTDTSADVKFVNDNNNKHALDGFTSNEPVLKKETWAQPVVPPSDSFNDDSFGDFEEAAPNSEPILSSMPATSFPAVLSSSFIVNSSAEEPRDVQKDDFDFGDFEAAQPSEMPLSTSFTQTQAPAPVISSFLSPPMRSSFTSSRTNQNTLQQSIAESSFEVKQSTMPVQEAAALDDDNQMFAGNTMEQSKPFAGNSAFAENWSSNLDHFSFAPVTKSPKPLNQTTEVDSLEIAGKDQPVPVVENMENPLVAKSFPEFEQPQETQQQDSTTTLGIATVDAIKPSFMVESASDEKIEVNLGELEAIHSFDSFGTVDQIVTDDKIVMQPVDIASSGLTSPDSFEAFDHQPNPVYKSDERFIGGDGVADDIAQDEFPLDAAPADDQNDVDPSGKIAVNLDDLVLTQGMESPEFKPVQDVTHFHQLEDENGSIQDVTVATIEFPDANFNALNLPSADFENSNHDESALNVFRVEQEQDNQPTIHENMTNVISPSNNFDSNRLVEPAKQEDLGNDDQPQQQQHQFGEEETDFGFSTAFVGKDGGGRDDHHRASSPPQELNESANIVFGFDPMSPPHANEQESQVDVQFTEKNNDDELIKNDLGYPASAFGDDKDDGIINEDSASFDKQTNPQNTVLEPAKSISAFDHFNVHDGQINGGTEDDVFGALETSDGLQEQQNAPFSPGMVPTVQHEDETNNNDEDDEFGEFQ